MPNTFLDSYFKGAELRQQQKLQAQQIMAQQAQQAMQLNFQKQQLAQQGQQFSVEQAFRASEAQRQHQEHEDSVKQQNAQQLFQNQLGLASSVGSGALRVTPQSLTPGVIGFPQAPPVGSVQFGGQTYRPSTLLERGQDAVAVKQQADQAQAQEDLREFQQSILRAKQMDPTLQFDEGQLGRLFVANTMKNPNAVGLLNNLPSSFGESGARALELDMKNLTREAMSDPEKFNDPKFLKRVSTARRLRDLYSPPPAVAGATPLVKNADDARRDSETAKAFAEGMASLKLNPNAKNFGDTFEDAKARILASIPASNYSGDAWSKAVDDYLKSNRRGSFDDMLIQTPPQTLPPR